MITAAITVTLIGALIVLAIIAVSLFIIHNIRR